MVKWNKLPTSYLVAAHVMFRLLQLFRLFRLTIIPFLVSLHGMVSESHTFLPSEPDRVVAKDSSRALVEFAGRASASANGPALSLSIGGKNILLPASLLDFLNPTSTTGGQNQLFSRELTPQPLAPEHPRFQNAV